MLNTLVMVEDSPASAIAIEAACRLNQDNCVRPIFTAPHANHDLAIGAGWAWKTWERESRRWAKKDVEHLIGVHREQFSNLKTPLVVSGRPVKAVIHCFLKNDHDLIVAGAPFRGMTPETLARRFQREIRQTARDLPLWIVNDFRPVKTVTALTDGSYPAEKALGFLNRMAYTLNVDITLVGINETEHPAVDRAELNLERGFAILREKRIDAKGMALRDRNQGGFKARLAQTDLLVLPFSSPACLSLFNSPGINFPSMLFYLSGDKT